MRPPREPVIRSASGCSDRQTAPAASYRGLLHALGFVGVVLRAQRFLTVDAGCVQQHLALCLDAAILVKRLGWTAPIKTIAKCFFGAIVPLMFHWKTPYL